MIKVYNFVVLTTFKVGYQILPNKSPSQSNKTYIVVRCLKDKQGNQKGFPLKAGHIIKFGRMGFRVKQTQDEN